MIALEAFKKPLSRWAEGLRRKCRLVRASQLTVLLLSASVLAAQEVSPDGVPSTSPPSGGLPLGLGESKGLLAPTPEDALADWIREDRLPPRLAMPRGYVDYGQALRVAMRAHAPALQKCYRRELKQSRDCYGELVLHLELEADGRQRQTRVDFSTLPGPELDPCILAALSKVVLPPPPHAGFTVRYPLVFTSKRTPPEVVEALRQRYQLEPLEPEPRRKKKASEPDPIPW